MYRAPRNPDFLTHFRHDLKIHLVLDLLRRALRAGIVCEKAAHSRFKLLPFNEYSSLLLYGIRAPAYLVKRTCLLRYAI